MTSKKPARKDGPSGRFYEVDVEGEARSLPSVTHILQVIAKPALVAWSAKEERAAVMEASADLYADLAQAAQLAKPLIRPVYMSTLEARIGSAKAHRRTMAKAGEIGSQAHEAIEWHLRDELRQRPGPAPKISPEATAAVAAWQTWRAGVNLKPIAIEQTVFSLKHGYAGTLDLLCEIDGIRTVVDWKTGKAIYQEAHLQTAAYRAALDEMGHGPVPNALIVRLPKVVGDPDFEVQQSPPTASLLPTFQAAVRLWTWWHQAEQEAKAAWKAKREGI